MRVSDYIDKKTLVVFGLLAVAALGYFFYSLSDKRQNGTQITALPLSSLDTALGRELLAALAELKSTKLDTSIFDDPVFDSLKDFGVVIAPLPVGRRNPFALFEEEAKTKGSGSAKPKSSAGATSKGAAPPKAPAREGFDVN